MENQDQEFQKTLVALQAASRNQRKKDTDEPLRTFSPEMLPRHILVIEAIGKGLDPKFTINEKNRTL